MKITGIITVGGDVIQLDNADPVAFVKDLSDAAVDDWDKVEAVKKKYGI